MILVTEKDAEAAARLLAHVGKRCEVAVRVLGFGIHVNGPLSFEDGVFFVQCWEGADKAHGLASFEPKHVATIRQSKSGTLLLTLRTEDPASSS